MQFLMCPSPRNTAHANHRDSSGDRLPPDHTRAMAPTTRTRSSLYLPRASTAPPTHVHVSYAHRPSAPPAPHRSRAQPACSTLALRPQPKRCSPRSARAGSAVRPSTRQHARRDRLDAHLAPPPPSIAPSRAEQHCSPPPHRAGRRARKHRGRTHQPIDRPRRLGAPRARCGAAPQHPHAPTMHACMCI